MGNVLNKLPKRVQGKAKAILNEMMNSATKEDSEKVEERF